MDHVYYGAIETKPVTIPMLKDDANQLLKKAAKKYTTKEISDQLDVLRGKLGDLSKALTDLAHQGLQSHSMVASGYIQICEALGFIATASLSVSGVLAVLGCLIVVVAGCIMVCKGLTDPLFWDALSNLAYKTCELGRSVAETVTSIYGLIKDEAVALMDKIKSLFGEELDKETIAAIELVRGVVL